MTERARRRRASRGALRTIAWIGGLAGFLAPWTALSAQPKPASTATPHAGSRPPVVIVHHIIRKIVIRDGAPTSTRVAGSAAAPVTTVPVPVAAPPVATSGGSAPP